MKTRMFKRGIALAAVMMMLLSACAASGTDNDKENSDALTWLIWGSYGTQQAFLELAAETYPEIELELLSYRGGNRTGYSWTEMRADDISDIFITSQILDEELAKERLVDLSTYPFVNEFSDKALEQVEIDGGIYLLPVSYNMYGIFYNKTLMEEMGWEVPADFAELETLCGEIEEAGLIPGIVGTHLTGNTFSAVFNLAKTTWLTTPAGMQWEQDFLAGKATAEGMWEGTMDYVKKYIDIGMFSVDPEDRSNSVLLEEYLGGRKAVFFTAAATTSLTAFENGDELGMMPYISEDGSKNVYMYSASCYFGISRRLTEPGNEQKLDNAIKLLSLLFSPEGQAAFVGDNTPCVMSVLTHTRLPQDAMIYDAQQAMWDGRAFEMTYAHWDGVLADMGQAYKDWFRSENNMDGAACIARMDELMQTYLNGVEHLYFCESMADFTQEETARLVAKALGSTAGADAVMVSLNELHEGGEEDGTGISGKLYAGKIDTDIMTTILPGSDGEYVVMTMTGAEAKALAAQGFALFGNDNPFPYILVTKGDVELEDGQTYRIAFFKQDYTEETANAYDAVIEEGSMRTIMRAYLEEQGTVSPDGNLWE